MKGKKIITFFLCVLLSLGIITAHEISIFAFAEGSDPAAITSLPSSVDLSSQFPTPSLQIGGSCSAWATCYALMSQAEYREYNWTVNNTTHAFSPQYLYSQIGNGIGYYNSNSYYLSFIKNQGCCTLPYYPFTSGTLSLPTNLQKENAKLYKIASYSTIYGRSTMKTYLNNGYGIAIAIRAYTGFDNLNSTNYIYSNVDTTEAFGLHSLCIVGYNDSISGGSFKVLNSWGPTWGNNGYGWITYDAFDDICCNSSGFLASARGVIIDSLSSDTFVLGDVDGDGDADATDARLVLRFSVGLESLTDAQQALGDVNGDGDTDAQDSSAILNYSVGLINILPLYV